MGNHQQSEFSIEYQRVLSLSIKVETKPIEIPCHHQSNTP